MKNLKHILALTALATAPALAGSHVVLFEDGRTLEVEGYDKQQEMTVLDFGGGATMAVPSDRISAVEAISRPAPAAAASHTGRTNRARTTGSAAVNRASNDTVQVAVQRRVNGKTSTRWRNAAGEYADIVAKAADKHDLDPALLAAVAHVESRFNPQAVSPKGAQGILQLMPQTAKRFGVKDSFDAAQNVEAGARYLSWLLDRYEGRTDLALAGYNAGEQAVDRYKGIPPYPETRTYVTRVMRQVDQLAR